MRPAPQPPSRSVWLLVVAMLAAVLAFTQLGCDALLTGGGDGSSDDDGGSKSKKGKKKKKKGKKKKKKGKKKKKKGDDDDDDDDDAPKPSKTACAEVIKIYECMRKKTPEAAREGIDQAIKSIKEMEQRLGPSAENACKNMIEGVRRSAKTMGCGDGGADGPRPLPVPPGPTPSPSPRPTTQSKRPSTSEWSRVTQEVIVQGASKLNCTAKRKREWLRVSCRGRNLSGGTPKKVRVTKGRGTWSDFVENGPAVTSLVVRFVEGVDVEAEFAWTDRSHTLQVSWPNGSAEPKIKGKFDPLP